jgi:hypothetical protein
MFVRLARISPTRPTTSFSGKMPGLAEINEAKQNTLSAIRSTLSADYSLEPPSILVTMHFRKIDLLWQVEERIEVIVRTRFVFSKLLLPKLIDASIRIP